jgi:HD-GYP domain-containing protein (c-di-GMP phosphodiesterase class II)
LVDAFDAMTHDRPYRPARGTQQALDEIRREAGHQFDPELAALFIADLEGAPGGLREESLEALAFVARQVRSPERPRPASAGAIGH